MWGALPEGRMGIAEHCQIEKSLLEASIEWQP
jgi:hypothetical protein